MQQQTYTARFKRPQEIVDFTKLSAHELVKLSEEWEKAARHMELKLDTVMGYTNMNDPDQKEYLEKLFKVANKLWKRLSTLENWRRTHKLRSAA